MLQNRDANLDSTNFQITFQNIKIKSFKLFNNSSVKKKPMKFNLLGYISFHENY